MGVEGFLGIDGTGCCVLFLSRIYYLLGKDNKNYFSEFGGGITPVIISGDLIDDDGDDTFSGTFGHIAHISAIVCKPLNGGFTFRAFISQII